MLNCRTTSHRLSDASFGATEPKNTYPERSSVQGFGDPFLSGRRESDCDSARVECEPRVDACSRPLLLDQ